MADGYDRFENEGGGGSFIIGLLTGTVLGAGLGILFAPKAGSELRNQLSEQAGNLANTASEQYRRATEAAADLADRGREMYDKARDAVTKGADEAQRYVRETAAGISGGSSHDAERGSSAEATRGSQSSAAGHSGATGSRPS